MTHKEWDLARRMYGVNWTEETAALGYCGTSEDPETPNDKFFRLFKSHYPEKSKYNVYFGEMHGHTCLSDGQPTLDKYFTNIRDKAKLDFAVVSDHEQGSFGKPELWDGPWELTKEKVKEYYEPGKFTTLLAYEMNTYPWYANMVICYNNHDGEMIRCKQDGHINQK